MLRESREQPVVLLFEDLHWIDDETQGLLDVIVESLPTARLLLLVNYRPEYRHAWGGKSYYTQLRIEPLTAASAVELLDGLLGTNRSLEPLKRLLLERTEGNPFFIEEWVRTLIETGILVGRPRRLPAREGPRHDARAGDGAGRARRAHRPAAVAGQAPAPIGCGDRQDRRPHAAGDGGRSGGARVAARARSTAGRGISRTKTSLFPELEYTFKHALTLEVAYQSLLRERRRMLHGGVLAALEARGRDQGPASVEVLAHHAVRGELWESAVTYLYRAGTNAQVQARHGPAADFYEAAADALQRLGDAADPRLALDVYLELWSTRISTNRVDGLGELAVRVEALAREQRARPRLAQLQVRQAQAIALANAIPGTLDDALGLAREAAAGADAADLRTRSYARVIMGIAYRDMGRLEEAIDAYDAGAGSFRQPNCSGPVPMLFWAVSRSTGSSVSSPGTTTTTWTSSSAPLKAKPDGHMSNREDR